MSVTPVGDVAAVLGEGPYWIPSESVLLWVDIPAGLLHQTQIPSGTTVSVELGEISAAFPAHGGGVLYAGGGRVVLRERADGLSGDYTERVVATAPPHPELRFNDGSVDPVGRVWVGSMHKGETDPLGTLYRLDSDPGSVVGSGSAAVAGSGAVLTPVVPGATVSNGLGWSPDGTRLYYADSPTRRLDVFDYDLATGEATGRRVFADLSSYDGVPDGLTVDGEGYVWVCMWDGGAIRRFAPSGALDAVVPVPVARPTSVAFGGDDMADLFVTTARIGLSAAGLAAQPLAGRLLHLRPGPVGLPATATSAVIPS
jgi:sugar lactone lactonase YvrE